MIEVKNLSKIFNEKLPNEFKAIENVNFSLKNGEILAINGISGSGKSTILSLIAGLIKPSSGEIIINETSLTKLSLKHLSIFRRQNIGLIFQSFNLIPSLSVWDNLILPTLICKNRNKERILGLLEHFDLMHKIDELAKNLSGGEMQRVAIIRALVNDANLILADEPTANLDKKLTQNLIEILNDLKNQNKKIIVASHDPKLLESGVISRIYELKQ